MGILGNPYYSVMKAGVKVSYEAGSFDVVIQGFLRSFTIKVPLKATDTLIAIEPNFFYNAIPTHLRFNLNAGFYFENGTDALDAKIPMETYWAAQSEIVFSLKGNGAADGWYVLALAL
jgi:hypothetical protein